MSTLLEYIYANTINDSDHFRRAQNIKSLSFTFTRISRKHFLLVKKKKKKRILIFFFFFVSSICVYASLSKIVN